MAGMERIVSPGGPASAKSEITASRFERFRNETARVPHPRVAMSLAEPPGISSRIDLEHDAERHDNRSCAGMWERGFSKPESSYRQLAQDTRSRQQLLADLGGTVGADELLVQALVGVCELPGVETQQVED